MSRDETLSLDYSLGAARGAHHEAFLYLVLASHDAHQPPARFGLTGVDEVLIGRAAERSATRVGARLELGVADSFMSSHHAQLRRALGGVMVEDAGSKNGVLVNGNPVHRQLLVDGDVIELGRTFFIFRAGVVLPAGEPRDSTPSAASLVPELSATLASLAQVARSEVTVLIRGEAGTGKEVAARSVHAASGRSGAFVAVNCGALPENLVESELFGYRRGAFSGAIEDRPGLVRAAHKGTLFLDEIAELRPSSQAALLRVLQEREVVPLGDTRGVPVDLRLLAATHTDLDALVAAGRFRVDLFTRLAGFALVIPPLRERREDLGLLVREFLPPGMEILPAAARRLFAHAWPGNVRELEKILGAARVLAGDAAIGVQHLPPNLGATKVAATTPPAHERAEEDDAERREIEDALARCAGNQSKAAKLLGISRSTLVTRLDRHGLARPRKGR